MVHLSEYQEEAWEFAMYPNAGLGLNPEYPTLGLTGEAGEIANKVKKIQRDGMTWADIAKDIESELGDVLWYVAALAREFDLDLDLIAERNLQKLHSRRARDAIQGSGDWR